MGESAEAYGIFGGLLREAALRFLLKQPRVLLDDFRTKVRFNEPIRNALVTVVLDDDVGLRGAALAATLAGLAE